MNIIGKRINSNRYFRQPYDVWRNMMQRCYNKKNPYYKNYGEKGITVCERWHDFNNFIEDYDKIKGFSEDVFFNKNIFLDLENCEFINIQESNKRKQHQMKPFKSTNLKTKKSKIFYNQSECADELKIRQGGISYALNKGNGQYKGYLFEFIN